MIIDRFRHIRQYYSSDCGIACIKMKRYLLIGLYIFVYLSAHSQTAGQILYSQQITIEVANVALLASADYSYYTIASSAQEEANSL